MKHLIHYMLTTNLKRDAFKKVAPKQPSRLPWMQSAAGQGKLVVTIPAFLCMGFTRFRIIWSTLTTIYSAMSANRSAPAARKETKCANINIS